MTKLLSTVRIAAAKLLLEYGLENQLLEQRLRSRKTLLARSVQDILSRFRSSGMDLNEIVDVYAECERGPILLKMNLDSAKLREIEELFGQKPESPVRDVPMWQNELFEQLKEEEGLRNETHIPTRGRTNYWVRCILERRKPGAYILIRSRRILKKISRSGEAD